MSVTDLATIQGTNTAGTPPTPGGSVKFFLCGPTAVDSTTLCTTGGTEVSTNAVTGSAPPVGEGQATSDAVNTSGSPLAPGRYCFRAEWTGDSNYANPGSHVGTGQSECFIVRQIATITVTTPSNRLGSPLSSPVDLGTILFDKAVVTGTTAGGSPPGTVDFFICDPSAGAGSGRLGDLRVGRRRARRQPEDALGRRGLRPAVAVGDLEPRRRGRRGGHVVLPRRVLAQRVQRRELPRVRRREPHRVLHGGRLDDDHLRADLAPERLGHRRVGRRDEPGRHAVVHPLLG